MAEIKPFFDPEYFNQCLGIINVPPAADQSVPPFNQMVTEAPEPTSYDPESDSSPRVAAKTSRDVSEERNHGTWKVGVVVAGLIGGAAVLGAIAGARVSDTLTTNTQAVSAPDATRPVLIPLLSPSPEGSNNPLALNSSLVPSQAPSTSINGIDLIIPSGQSSPSLTQNKPPLNYQPGFISFGKLNNGCRELGVYSTAPTTVFFKANRHDYSFSIPTMPFDLYTCAENPQVIMTDNGIDIENNVVKKRILINQESFSFKAVGPSVPQYLGETAIKTIFDAQKMIAEGYTSVCDLPGVIGCPGVSVPKEYVLSTQQINTYKLTALVNSLQVAQSSCAPVEIATEQRAIRASFVAQAVSQGIPASLITSQNLDISFVDANGHAVTSPPDYVGTLEASYLKAGGNIDSTKLFGKQLPSQVSCVPNEIVNLPSQKG